MHMANNAVAGNAVVQKNMGMPTALPSFSKATRAYATKASTVSSSVSVNADKVDDKFEGIEQQLRKTWIASNNNISALCQLDAQLVIAICVFSYDQLSLDNTQGCDYIWLVKTGYCLFTKQHPAFCYIFIKVY